MPDVEPQVRKKVFSEKAHSPMRFMEEHVVFDQERDALVRFRGMFTMPDWFGVEDNEDDYIVEDSWMRLDILAKRYYNDEELWWVIAARNHIDLPDAQMYKGRRLKIPRKDWVDRKLLPQAKNLVQQK
jgi:hypothetical protein